MNTTDSILDSVKKVLGLPPEYTPFDTDIIIHINTVFGILRQLGVRSTSYSISDNTAKWSDYLTEYPDLDMVKSYMYAKVRMMFDPPSGAHGEALKSTIEELEWRMNFEVEVM